MHRRMDETGRRQFKAEVKAESEPYKHKPSNRDSLAFSLTSWIPRCLLCCCHDPLYPVLKFSLLYRQVVLFDGPCLSHRFACCSISVSLPLSCKHCTQWLHCCCFGFIKGPLVLGTHLSHICHIASAKGQACACNQECIAAGALSSGTSSECAAGSSSGAHSAQLSLRDHLLQH